MYDDGFDSGLKFFSDPTVSPEVVAEIMNDLPAMKNAPRYDDGRADQVLPADGIGKVQSNVISPIIVTPYSVGGGYIGSVFAEQDALQQGAARVESGQARGDLVYFGESEYVEECFDSVLESLGVRSQDKVFAVVHVVFFEENEESLEEDGGFPYVFYLEQLKLICGPAAGRFHESVKRHCVEQVLTIGEAMMDFYQYQKAKYNPGNDLFPRELRGIIGGDGDYEREQLAFGILVENREEGVYRIWSRAALCTK